MKDPMIESSSTHHVVIVGGGFAGLSAAKALANKPVRVTLVDKRNFHLFQPLLYQVATGGLSPGDIAYPIRAALATAKNVRVLAAEVVDVLPQEQQILLDEGQLDYDTLILATGTETHYFGNDAWRPRAPGLKTVEDALEMRRRVLSAFEMAEKEQDPDLRKAWLNFVVVGGGPTGVELAGAIAGLAQETLRGEFRSIESNEAQIFLFEGQQRVLNTFPDDLSAKALRSLNNKGIIVRTQSLLTAVESGRIHYRVQGESTEHQLPTQTVLWAAGIQASPLGRLLAQRTNASFDPMGRIIVEPDLTVTNFPDIFVLGDLAHFSHNLDQPLPGVAQVAIQGGHYAARSVVSRLKGRAIKPFRYRDRGSMAVIGRNSAVVDLGRLQLSGPLAWLLWLFIHISFLIGFDNKLIVLFQWSWSYFTRKHGARLITPERGKDSS